MPTDKASLAFVPLRPHRLSEEVHRQIKEAILEGHYKPGDRLPPERVFCETFGVGRPVIREALRFLENSGLISVRPGAGGGAFVQKIDSSVLAHTLEGIVKMDNVSMKDLTDARLALEMGALPLIFEQLQTEDIEALESNIEEVRENLRNRIRGKRNLTFHLLLMKTSRNPLLSKVAEAFFELMGKLLEKYEYSEERSRAVVDIHERFVQLVRKKRYDEARRLLEAHIKDSLVLFSRPLAGGGTPGEGPGDRRLG